VRGGSAVGCAFRFVTAANRLSPLRSGGGGDSGVSAFSVFVSAAGQVLIFCCIFCAGDAVRACLGYDPCDESISNR